MSVLKNRWVVEAGRIIRMLAGAIIIYVLSYAPFLFAVQALGSDYHRGPYYRSPALFRPIDQLMCSQHSRHISPIYFKYAELFGVRNCAEMQAWYTAMGISDPSTEIHFNIQAL